MRPSDFPDERTLVPYETSKFVARRVVVFAPHPDDEVLGCGGALAELLDGGARVDVVLVTDGAAGARDAEERDRIASRRLEESRRALDDLGGGSLHAGVLPDRGLAERLPEVEALLSRWLLEILPDLVFAPSPVETHPDHRAVAAALFGVAARAPADPAAKALESATIAFFELSQPIRPNFLFDATRVRARKERAMGAFASQAKERDYAGFVRGLNSYRRLTLSADVLSVEAYSVSAGFRLRNDPRGVVRALLPTAPDPVG